MLSLFLIYMLKFLFKKNTINGKLSNFVILTKVSSMCMHGEREREREREALSKLIGWIMYHV